MINKFYREIIEFHNNDADIIEIFEYESSELKILIAVDNEKFGTAIGGCRYVNNTKREEAINEVAKMARAMTKKNILAGLSFDGGKAFIYYNRLPRNEMLKRFGEVLNEMRGRYYTTNDMGVDLDDVITLKQYSPFVRGSKYNGRTLPATAYGVYKSLKASVEYIFESSDLQGREISLQGIGNVGMPLVNFLLNEKCKLFVDEINEEKKLKNNSLFSFIESGTDFVTLPVDIIMPCAIGGVIKYKNIDNITAKLIVGGANNQLEDDALDTTLFEKGILYVPDILANCGGMIDLECEGENYNEKYVFERVSEIYTKTKYFLEESKKLKKSMLALVNDYVHERIIKD
jgi:leucine dehydrogenase